jgi:hypothetical protein
MPSTVGATIVPFAERSGRAGVSVDRRAGANQDMEAALKTNADLAARLLREAAFIYRTLGQGDNADRQRMMEFADLYEKVADQVERDPAGSFIASAESADAEG